MHYTDELTRSCCLCEGETTPVHERRSSERRTVAIKSSRRHYGSSSNGASSCQYLVDAADRSLSRRHSTASHCTLL